MDTKKWHEQIGKSIDSGNADDFVTYLTEDAVFRFGNQPDVTGKPAIRDYVAAFFSMIKASEQKVINYWTGNGSVVWQGEVTYTRLDDKKVTVNFTNIFYISSNLIKDYLIYMDISPLFAS